MLTLPSRSSGDAPARGAGSVAISTAVDQLLSSASNALVVFVLAQVSTAGQFGIIGLLVTVLTVCTGFVRGALGTPLLLTSNRENREIAAESNYATTWSLCIGVVGGFLLLTLGVVWHEPWMGLAFAVALPAVLVQDVLRLTAIAMGKPNCAGIADALWAASMLGIFIANLIGVRESAEISVYLWALSGLVSAGILAFGLRVAPRRSKILDWWRKEWAARLRFGSVYAVGQIGFVFVTLAAVTTAGSVAAAGIRGATTLFGPIATLLMAVPMVFVPHAVRSGNFLGDQWRLMSRTSSATSLLTVVATGCLMAVPAGLGDAILGASWPATFSVLPYIGLSAAAMCWAVGVTTIFQSRNASRTVFGLNMLLIGLQLTASFAAGSIFGNAIAIAISLACSNLLVAVAGVLCVHRSIRADRIRSRAGSSPAVDVSGGMSIQ